MPTFAYRKTINNYRNREQNQINKNIKDIRLCFVYGQDGNTMTVSTLNADGLSITPKLKYEYQYDANGNLLEKKAYRWNKDNRSWQPAYLLNYLPGDGIYMIDYAEYDKVSGAFTQNIQTSIYYQQAESDLLLTEVQR